MENHVGEELCRLFAEDTEVEWASVLRRSKEAARRIQTSGAVVRPRGPMAPLQVQQPQHHQQQQQQQGNRRGGGGGNNSGGGGFQRDQRNHRNRGGFGAGHSSFDNSHDMGRYTAQRSHKDSQIFSSGLTSVMCVCLSYYDTSADFSRSDLRVP